MGSTSASGPYTAGGPAVPNPRIYVIARDQADFDDYAYPASITQEYLDFDFLRVRDAVSILERKPAIIHITKNGRQNPEYQQMMMNIALLDIEPAVHEFKHDVPEALDPDSLERWLAT